MYDPKLQALYDAEADRHDVIQRYILKYGPHFTMVDGEDPINQEWDEADARVAAARKALLDSPDK